MAGGDMEHNAWDDWWQCRDDAMLQAITLWRMLRDSVVVWRNSAGWQCRLVSTIMPDDAKGGGLWGLPIYILNDALNKVSGHYINWYTVSIVTRGGFVISATDNQRITVDKEVEKIQDRRRKRGHR